MTNQSSVPYNSNLIWSKSDIPKFKPVRTGIFISLLFAFLPITPEAHSQISAESKEQMGDTLFVRQIVLCKSLRNHEPVDVVEAFSVADKRGLCYVRIHNTKRPAYITFRWFYKDEHYASIKNKVGVSKNWRTYSSVRLRPGRWRVEVVNEDGKLLEGIGFEVNENKNQH